MLIKYTCWPETRKETDSQQSVWGWAAQAKNCNCSIEQMVQLVRVANPDSLVCHSANYDRTEDKGFYVLIITIYCNSIWFHFIWRFFIFTNSIAEELYRELICIRGHCPRPEMNSNVWGFSWGHYRLRLRTVTEYAYNLEEVWLRMVCLSYLIKIVSN